VITIFRADLLDRAREPGRAACGYGNRSSFAVGHGDRLAGRFEIAVKVVERDDTDFDRPDCNRAHSRVVVARRRLGRSDSQKREDQRGESGKVLARQGNFPFAGVRLPHAYPARMTE
jgi:hypothetical protein